MVRKNAIEKARSRLLPDLREKPWLVSLGVGSIDGEVGLIVSVRKGAKSAATRMVNNRAIPVPVRVREVSKIRTLPGGKRDGAISASAHAKLKATATRRLSRTDSE